MKSKLITCKRGETQENLDAASTEGWELVGVIAVDGWRELYFRWPAPIQAARMPNPLDQILNGGPFGGGR